MDGSHFEHKAAGKKPGPHLERRLTAAFVKVAPPGRHTDGGGLYLEVDRSGARRWLLRITVKKRRRDYGLGSANVVSLADARAKAFELRRIAALGGNPRAHTRAGDGQDMTFEVMARRVHERKFQDKMNNGKHIAQWIQTLATYAFPTIGKMSVQEICPASAPMGQIGVIEERRISGSSKPSRDLVRGTWLEAGCPSSDDLGHEGLIGNGGSGSSMVQFMPLSGDASSGAFRSSLP